MAREMGGGGRGEARWWEIIREQQGSGQRVGEFCRKHKLAESTFYRWRRTLARREGEPSKRSSRMARASFVPVRVAEEAATGSAGRMEITLAGGHRVRVTPPVDRRALAEVLAVLAGMTDVPREGEDRRC
jgi:transposase-like protein